MIGRRKPPTDVPFAPGARPVRRRPSKAAAAKAAANLDVRSVNYAVSPLLASRTPAWRSKFLVALVGAGFSVLVGRALYVQVIGSDFFLKKGEVRYAHSVELNASRGRIVDRNGAILAASLPAPSVWAIPKDFEADVGQRRALARLLAMTPKELDDRLEDNANFVWLRRQVADDTGRDIQALHLKGIHAWSEYKRQYPQGEAAAHVVGFTNVEDRGQEGIELAFQQQLAGRNGERRVIRDGRGRVVDDIGDSVAAVDGRDIALSIDSKVQFFAYQRIRDAVRENKAKAGSVVVLDAQTGDVLALANYPSYLPDDRRHLTGAQLRNRALTDTFEPGSTVKPFIAGWALETKRVTPNTVIHTAPGRISMGGFVISDSHAHGDLTVSEVIQKSSNIGAMRMGMQFQPREMWELYNRAGFGQKPQIGFPGAVTGRLRPWAGWRPIEQATMSYGYGLSASLFQIAQAYTVFTNDGVRLPVHLTGTALAAPTAAAAQTGGPAAVGGVAATAAAVATAVDAAGSAPAGAGPAAGAVAGTGLQAGIRVLSPETARTVREMLALVCGPGGTAPKAQTVGYSVGGKSGTAYKQEGRGYATKKYRSWFVGLSPIAHPRIIVAVMVDEPSNGQWYGGDVAAPVFSDVVQKTLPVLGVRPDIDVRTQIVAHGPVAGVDESF